MLLIESLFASKETFSAKGCRDGELIEGGRRTKAPFRVNCSNTNMHSQEYSLHKDPSLLILGALYKSATE